VTLNDEAKKYGAPQPPNHTSMNDDGVDMNDYFGGLVNNVVRVRVRIRNIGKIFEICRYEDIHTLHLYYILLQY